MTEQVLLTYAFGGLLFLLFAAVVVIHDQAKKLRDNRSVIRSLIASVNELQGVVSMLSQRRVVPFVPRDSVRHSDSQRVH